MKKRFIDSNHVKEKTAKMIERGRVMFRELWYTPKIIMFLINITLYSTHSYTNLYLKKQGVLKTDIAWIAGCSGLQFFASPLFTMLGDRFNCHKLLLITVCIVAFGSYCMMLVPLEGATNLAKVAYYGSMLNLHGICVSGMFPLVDHAILVLLSRKLNYTKEMFGKQRLWGTFGHVLGTIIVGAITHDSYTPMFYAYGVATFLLVLSVQFLLPQDLSEANQALNENAQAKPSKKSGDIERDDGEKEPVPTFGESCRFLFTNSQFLFLLLVVVVNGLCSSIPTHFMPILLKEKLKLENKALGGYVAFRAIPEVILFFYGKPLLKTLGPYWMILFSQFFASTRNLGYYLLSSPDHQPLIGLLEIFKGLASASFITSCVHICTTIAPITMKASAQGIFLGVYKGLALSLGGILGGVLDGNLDLVFISTSILSYFTLCLFFVKFGFFDRTLGLKCCPTRKVSCEGTPTVTEKAQESDVELKVVEIEKTATTPINKE